MNNEIYINKIISSLKTKLNENNELYRNYYKGEVILSKVEFNSSLDDISILEDINITLPEEYIEFLKISNGAKLFKDDYYGSNYILELYSLEKICEEKNFYLHDLNISNCYPIGILLDNCELIVYEDRVKYKKYYLGLSDNSKRFEYGFQEWLDKFIIAQGNEFWLLNNSY